jgi:hypothetical protein
MMIGIMPVRCLPRIVDDDGPRALGRAQLKDEHAALELDDRDGRLCGGP